MLGKTTNFLRETRKELDKVTWPTRQELVSSTIVVIVTTLALAAFIGLIDSILSIAVRVIIR